MARVLPSSSSMAVLLLLVVAAVLSNVPSSALAASVSSSSSLHNPAESDETTDSSSGGDGGEQQAPPSPSSSDDDDDDNEEQEQEQVMDKEQQKEKEKERQMAKEKAFAAEKAVQQELLKYAKEKGLVSPTNGTGWYKGIAREFLDAHNRLRARYGVAPMKWDKKLARQARRWSNAMRKDCKVLHSGHKLGENTLGESIFRSHDDWNATARDAIAEWGKEESIYDKEKELCKDGRNFKLCGHFALMVGKRSTKVGCARAECFKGGVFITCNYYATDLNKKNKSKSPPSSN